MTMTLAQFVLQTACWTVALLGVEAVLACVAGGRADRAAARWSR